MAGNEAWDHDPRAGMLANQGRTAPDQPSLLPPPKPPMPAGMKVTLWLAGPWVFGVLIVVLTRKSVRNLSCMFDTTEDRPLVAQTTSRRSTEMSPAAAGRLPRWRRR